MKKSQTAKRTSVKDLPKRKYEVAKDEATQVKGGRERRGSVVSVSEIVVTKTTDATSPL